jgi:protocatechuate 3,4-dioxygenase beta subunit
MEQNQQPALQREFSMDFDDAMVGRILSRRETLRAAAHAGIGMALVGGLGRIVRAAANTTQPSASPLVVSPALTEGPFFVDENLNRSDLTAGTTRPSVINGWPLALAFTVYKLTGSDYRPLKDTHVDVWHCDASGAYSDQSKRMNREDTSKQTWLRGYQVTDANGQVKFSTIVPGWYNGRTPHIHFKVRNFSPAGKSTTEFTSQLFFHDEDTDRIYANAPYNDHGKRDQRNEDDGIFSEREADGATAGSHLLLDLKSDGGKLLTTSFAIVLTDQSLHAPHGRDRGRGGPPDGPPPDGDFGPPPDGGPPPQ